MPKARNDDDRQWAALRSFTEDDEELAKEYDVEPDTIAGWRRRFFPNRQKVNGSAPGSSVQSSDELSDEVADIFASLSEDNMTVDCLLPPYDGNGTRSEREQEILESLPEGGGVAITRSNSNSKFSFFMNTDDLQTATSVGANFEMPQDTRALPVSDVLNRCEQAFSRKAWEDYLVEAGTLHAEMHRFAPDEDACNDLIEDCRMRLAEDFEYLDYPGPIPSAVRTTASKMPIAADRGGMRWIPSTDIEPPEPGVVYWCVGSIYDHDDRTRDVLDPVPDGYSRTRKSFSNDYYSDHDYEHKSLYLKMMSFTGYDEQTGHLKGFSEVIVRYPVLADEAAYEHINAGFRKEVERERNVENRTGRSARIPSTR